MRPFCLAILACTSTAFAIDPKYRTMNEEQWKRVNPAIRQEQLFKTRDEVCDYFWNREWFFEAVERYAKTGVKQKVKVPHGLVIVFYEGDNEDDVKRRCFDTGASLIASHVVKGKRGRFYAAKMWADENVVSLHAIQAGRDAAWRRAMERDNQR